MALMSLYCIELFPNAFAIMCQPGRGHADHVHQAPKPSCQDLHCCDSHCSFSHWPEQIILTHTLSEESCFLLPWCDNTILCKLPQSQFSIWYRNMVPFTVKSQYGDPHFRFANI